MPKNVINYNKQIVGIIVVLTSCLYACAPNKVVARKVNREFKSSTIINQYQVGFALYDKDKNEMVFQKDADKYFTPASNTKLFTFYAGLKIIPPGRYTSSFYGFGWQWDDYNDYYQPEINELPIMDNVILVSAGQNPGSMTILPNSFASCFVKDSTEKIKPFKVIRNFNENIFHYPATPITEKYNQQIPYKLNATTTVNLLSDTLKKYVGMIEMKMPISAKTIYNMKSDSVFKQMLLPSDNFVAEQLLLVYADKLGEEMNTSKIIAKIEKQYLSSLPDKPQWVDGSGLSRGNLFTPRDMVALLDMIYKEVNDEKRLFNLLPAGGKTGTLRNAYPKTENPFVFGKTGSLSNNHNQSGYVVTKKGKVYIFSFMNNNFVLPTADVRKEMVRIMTYIHDNF